MRSVPTRSDPEGTADAILAAARFGVPLAPANHVQRPHLTAALALSDELPLVLVSAPAGTGKTTTVAEWVRAEGSTATEWIDFGDGETAFWGHVLEALRRLGLAVPRTWSVTAGAVLGHQRLTALAGLVVGAPERLTVVIDGYELTSLPLGREVDFLLRHCMGRLRLVFVGRTDPVLALYRYRLTDTLLELRAPDLAFSDLEAAQLLGYAGVEVSAEAARDLNRRVSGWIAGLRFAARALAPQADPAAHLAMAVEQTTDINEYLVGEVLDAQTTVVRRFLLDTSVSDVVCAELVELLGGGTAVQIMNELVDRRAFVEPVPGRPGCYHYPPFFRNLLRAVLAYESPDRMVEVQRIASRWLRSQGLHAKSLAHLAAIGAWEDMATLIVEEELVGQLLLEEPGGPLREGVRELPADLDVAAACVVRAASALTEGDEPGCSRELAAARQTQHDDVVGGALGLAIAAVDALRASCSDPSGTAVALVEEAERLLAEAPATSPTQPASELATVVAFSRGLTALRRGDLPAAGTALAGAVDHAPAGTSTAFRANCMGYLAIAHAVQGELSSAVHEAEESLTIAAQAGLSLLDASPSAHVALAWVGVERCDADVVRDHVALARASRKLSDHPICSALVEAATATLERADGHAGSAMDRLETAAVTVAGRDPWIADQLRIEAARLSVRRGFPEQALVTLEGVEEHESAEVRVTTAEAYVERHVPGAVDKFLTPAAQADAPLGTQVRALLAAAATTSHHRPQGQPGPALSDALRLAARERMRRPFRDAGPSVRRLVTADPHLVQEHPWLHLGAQPGPTHTRTDGERGLPIVVEPLTAKELEVLGHLAELLTTDEIAEKMFVSVNTVRTHIRNILRKLGVNRRNAAIRRARELGVLED
jgi:LuxR family maltose regulon positive regulatory protein